MNLLQNFGAAVGDLFDLRHDADYVETDSSIRKNVHFKSANAWTLVFAIFIASIGLNMNSTASIIGAMLISPLMGPIVAFGYGLGISDTILLKTAVRNLSVAVVLSLLTSTLYFFVTPITDAQSELIARTYPTFYDVLIAVLGGATGIVALSRKDKSNAIPGVAIATALMPPLCTAGYGIATKQPKFILGALFLFVINCVFIAVSTYVMVRVLSFKKALSEAEEKSPRAVDRWVAIVSALIILPSLGLAWSLMQETTFKHRAKNFVLQELTLPGSVVMKEKISTSWRSKSIELTIVGQKVTDAEIDRIRAKLPSYKLAGTELKLKQISFEDAVKQKLDLKGKKERLPEVTLLKAPVDQEGISKELAIIFVDFKELHASEDTLGLVWKKVVKPAQKGLAEKFLRQRLQKPEIRVTHLAELK